MTDIFPYTGAASDNYDVNITEDFKSRHEEMEEDYEHELESGGKAEDLANMKKELEDLKLEHTKGLKYLNKSTGRKIVYTSISYPLNRPAIMKWVLSEDATYGQLLEIHAQAYNLIYELEEQSSTMGDPGHIPGMFNRRRSDGMFGIWGHDIGDLVYNGGSTITIGAHHVVCDFDVDS